LWKVAVVKVVEKMMELQKLETAKLAQDPLLMIEMDRQPINRSMIQDRIGVSSTSLLVRRKSSGGSSTVSGGTEQSGEKRARKPTVMSFPSSSSSSSSQGTSGSSSNSGDNRSKFDPFASRPTVSHSVFHVNKDKEALAKLIADVDEKELANANGTPCPECNSKLTFIKDSHQLYDISKSEVWGGASSSMRDTEEILFCRACKYEGKAS